MASRSPSQIYLSTRGGERGLSFEAVVLKGLASDGGLFIPHQIPLLPSDWSSRWSSMTFQQLAFEIFSLYISPDEVPSDDLRHIIDKSYSTFRAPEVTPLVALDPSRDLHLLELFHGPTFAFKDVALQFLGNLFEYFLVRRNNAAAQADSAPRHHLTVIGATSGDTGSAAIYGLRGKKDVSVFIMFPTGKVSPVQEAQMTTVLDTNVHNLSVDGTFDDCQDFVKALFADPLINQSHQLAAVNSINWARILAQITYYFAAYFALARCHSTPGSKPSSRSPPPAPRFVVPTGNFGDILAGFFAMRMGLPVDKLVVATNENDILHRFWQTGTYQKHSSPGDGGEAGSKETLSPAMDILVSSNFERLLWFLAHDTVSANDEDQRAAAAGSSVKAWLDRLRTTGGFSVDADVWQAAKQTFESERVGDDQTLDTIRNVFSWSTTPPPSRYILDPHSAVGVAAALRSLERSPQAPHVALSTAHPAKFSRAVEMALASVPDFSFPALLPPEFVGLEDLPRRVTHVSRADGLNGLRDLVMREVKAEGV